MSDLGFETKLLQGEIKLAKSSADGSIGRVEGHSALWDIPDLDDDIFAKGSFQRAINELHSRGMVKFRYAHTTPLGWLTHMAEDSKGLEYAGEIADTAFGRELKPLIRRGGVDQSSPQFRASKVMFDESRKGRHGYPVRIIQEAFPTVEISILDLGAQPSSSASLKALGLHAPLLAHVATLLDIGAVTLGEVKRALPYRDLPFADRGRAWDADGATKRVQDWADAGEGPNAQYAKAFLFVEAERAEHLSAFRFPIADVVDGELRVVPSAVLAAAKALQIDSSLPEGERKALKAHLGQYYAKMRREFEDDDLVAPWDEKTLKIESSLERLNSTLQGWKDALTAR